MKKTPLVFLASLAAAAAGIASTAVLSGHGLTSFAFFGDLNARGAGAFNEFAASITAVALRVFWTLVAGIAALGFCGAPLRLHGAQVAGVFGILLLAGFAAAALVVPTFGISVLVFGVLALYAVPAAAFAGRPAVDAVIESVRIAAKNFAASAAAVIAVIALALAGGFLGRLAPGVPLLGEAASWLALEAFAVVAVAGAAGVYLREEHLC